jgi:hypothetical protein
METPSTSSVRTQPANPLKAIALIGLVAGTLDIIAATVAAQLNPITILQYIASAAFGREAFSGGLGMAFWGLFFHYLIAYSWTILYFLIYPKFAFLSRHPILSGLAYGIVVWIIMNRVVVPLSQINQRPFDLVNAMKGMAILMVMIGLPISWLTHRYYSRA